MARKPATKLTKILKPQRTSTTSRREKIDRNDPCPCGSGKKYKKCCGDPEQKSFGSWLKKLVKKNK